jgi:hypothetical protein
MAETPAQAVEANSNENCNTTMTNPTSSCMTHRKNGRSTKDSCFSRGLQIEKTEKQQHEDATLATRRQQEDKKYSELKKMIASATMAETPAQAVETENCNATMACLGRRLIKAQRATNKGDIESKIETMVLLAAAVVMTSDLTDDPNPKHHNMNMNALSRAHEEGKTMAQAPAQAVETNTW